MSTHYPYLVLGGGMTADAAVKGIRELDATGRIGVIGDEQDAPYARPPLSKALWKGDPFESVWRGTEEVGAELHLGRRATGLDVHTKRVTDDQGAEYTFEKVLVATGGTPRRPWDVEGVIYYRTLEDYRRLRALADEGRTFAIIGGGFIGSEIAAALAMQGRDVTMVFPEQGIGARVFPQDLSAFLADYYAEKGVRTVPGQKVKGVWREGDRSVVETESGRTITADAVVAGLGIVPNVELAARAGLTVEDGILVDEHLRAGHPDVYAAGDVARFLAPALEKRIRVEHEDNAVTMGRHAGRSMAGDATPYEHLPFFYSDLFELGYEAVGDTDPRLEVVADWKEPFREGVVYYLDGNRVRGVLLWNVWGQVDVARALIAEKKPLERRELVGRIRG